MSEFLVADPPITKLVDTFFRDPNFRYPIDTTSANTSQRFREIGPARNIMPSETWPVSPTYVFIFLTLGMYFQ